MGGFHLVLASVLVTVSATWFALRSWSTRSMREAARRELARDGAKAVLARIEAGFELGRREYARWERVGVEHTAYAHGATHEIRRQKRLHRYRAIVLEEIRRGAAGSER